MLAAERGIPGRLEAGGSLLKPLFVGNNVELILPEIFWSRLKREYGTNTFVQSRGEAAAVTRSVEIILTCLRNEDFCVNVPSASASYF